MMLRKLAGILAVWLLGLTLAVAQGPAPDQASGGPDQSAGQDQPGGARGMRGQRGQMRGGMGGGQQMMLEQLKTQLKATDDEWKALEPLIQAVMTAEREAMVGGRGMGMMGRGMMGGRGNRGAGGPGGAPTDSAGAPPADNASGAPAGAAAAGGGRGRMGATQQQMPEREALQKAVDAEQPDAADIKAKLKAYKEAVAKKQEALKEARAKLREVCDARKDAVLVLAGILD